MKTFSDRKRIGFTLVELLVVIAVIGILIALIFPAIGNAMARSRRIQCLNNLRNIGQVCILYSQRRVNGLFPNANGHTPTNWKTSETSLKDIINLMNELKLPATIWYCPQLEREGHPLFSTKNPKSMLYLTPSSSEVWLGYVYLANPTGTDNAAWLPKWVRDPPFYRSMMESPRAPLAADICAADRTSNTDPLQAQWSLFPHEGIARPQVSNVVRFDGSAESVPVRELAIGLQYYGPTDLYWPK